MKRVNPVWGNLPGSFTREARWANADRFAG